MTYNEMKELAREAAIEWQQESAEMSLSYGECAEIGEHFYKMGETVRTSSGVSGERHPLLNGLQDVKSVGMVQFPSHTKNVIHGK